MSLAMAKLGTAFSFEATSAAFDELARSTSYRYASQERVGAAEGLQFLGEGSDTIRLSGVIYPHHRGGLGQLDTLREVASRGKPQRLVDGRGRVLGEWVIESIEETQGAFLAGGLPRRQAFVLQLKRYRG